jgi:hypothetical protein
MRVALLYCRSMLTITGVITVNGGLTPSVSSAYRLQLVSAASPSASMLHLLRTTLLQAPSVLFVREFAPPCQLVQAISHYVRDRP